ncbi:hypothetical protein NPS01_22500 [Nocardioides psychrotolerans]|uniref:Helix-turn-helix domain-containing protein n=1 Tax=Nocardioides psychrotolerans TaxID=1005945 RepID=A0A1I3I6G5_9ACTN|nr:helix-turn-helix domain-containing protein [Nocardioides psychrotolerans]GEP38587.1 hypothetical protein NPS01_22500 [Nocardioides psychrotolerans]SFI43460.1 Helix-turn-helix domain-containing protein [Nocardioides psychrotolerans]
MSTWEDEQPIDYALTNAGWAAARTPVTLTISEAVAYAGRVKSRILELARTGRVEAVQVDGRWLIDGASLDAYLAQPRRPGIRRRTAGPRRVSAEPLLRQIALRGGDAACGVEHGSAAQKALERAREDGTVTVWTADHLAVHLLGLTLWDLWDAPGET